MMAQDQGSQRERREAQKVAPSPGHPQTVANDGSFRQAPTRPMTIPRHVAWGNFRAAASVRASMMSGPRTSALNALALLILVVAACTGPPGSSASGTETVSVAGRATAGPVCPVERNPPDPACAARPVAGAALVIENAASGREVGRVTTDSDGRFSISLRPGAYRLVPQSVSGLMGGAQPVDFVVDAHAPTPTLAVTYDTGIR